MSKKQLNVADALFSKVKQRVLGLLYSRPEHDFYTNEIIRLTHIGNGAVQRELKNLTAVGLINIKLSGNQKRYQANSHALFFEELRSIVLKSFGLVDVLQQALEPMSDRIEIAFIYGSIAKKIDTANSDIDLMIIGNDLTYADFFQAFEQAELKLQRKINPTFYSPVEWQRKYKAGNNFLNKIIEQPKEFLLGTEHELRKLG